jgi:transcriptional regulator with XRE-family HTH domain
MDYGKRIKELRESARMTQAEFAEAAQITQAHVSQIESGKLGLTVKTADKLCAALGITLSKLFEE